MNWTVLTWGLLGIAVLAVGIWLKHLQARFHAGLVAADDPVAGLQGSKLYRQRFQAWLFGIGTDRGWSGSALTVIAALVVLGLAAWSILPVIFGPGDAG